MVLWSTVTSTWSTYERVRSMPPMAAFAEQIPVRRYTLTMPPNPRALPSVDAVLRALGTDGTPHALAAIAARTVLAEARSGIRDGGTVPTHDDIVARVRSLLTQHLIPSLRPVINAGGVILQTNLGRAPLSERAIAAMDAIARGYSNLEYDIEAGTRGSRHDHVRELIHRVTGAEDGIIVNNNAAALSMALQVFARGSEVIISRGQAVEIGGGFRIPDVLRQSGANLVEVGTTNRTYAHDYDAAWTENTAAILRVHTSNFRVVGFTTEPTLNELATVAHHRGGLLLDDLGSGCLVDTTAYGIPHEPTVQESLAAGADLALFSGDKLLGGPQCGIIIGRAELVARLRTHPLARSLRVDKLTIAAFIATLMSYAEGHERDEIPVWRMASIPLSTVRRRALRWARAAGPAARLREGVTMIGGGSLPGEGVRTWCAAVRPPGGADHYAWALRTVQPPIITRISDGEVLLDPRTVDPRDDRIIAERLDALRTNNKTAEGV